MILLLNRKPSSLSRPRMAMGSALSSMRLAIDSFPALRQGARAFHSAGSNWTVFAEFAQALLG